MKSLTIEEIHEETLKVLQVVHEFCVSRGIRYMLHGGTLIGAIRHQGFIPWDDDADVSMPRPDYERFIREFPDSESFKVFAPEKDNCALLYGRICEMKRTYLKSKMAWCDDSPGIGVDIFPLDGVAADSDNAFRPVVEQALVYMNRAYWYRYYPWMNWKDLSFSAKLAAVGSVIKNPKFILKRMLKSSLLRKNFTAFRRFCLSNAFDACRYCAQFGHPIAKTRERTNVEWLREYIPVSFENIQLMVPVDYDKVLTQWFGDYMKLPPVEKRENHTAFQTIFWR